MLSDKCMFRYDGISHSIPVWNMEVCVHVQWDVTAKLLCH